MVTRPYADTMISRAAFASRTTASRSSSSTATAGIICRSVENDSNENKETANKPQSRLARLAQDWLEEEEDELQLYWERFDDKKGGSDEEGAGSSSQARRNARGDQDEDGGSPLTTEQRLERYCDRRGINRRRERERAAEIQQALEAARGATTPEQAILYLEEVRPWLQINSKLGGTALLELAIALCQRDGVPDEALCEELLGNMHVRREVQLLLKNGPSKRDAEASLWQGFSFFDNPNGWWN